MTHEAILAALADPTRRAVLDRLRQGPLHVVSIAQDLPVTRPAVSQHLKVLMDAGLVTMTPDGRRNLYALTEGGAGPLVEWLGALTVTPEVQAVEAGIRREVTVRLTPEEAWQLLCDDIAIWWPVGVVSASARDAGALPQALLLDLDAGKLQEVAFDGVEVTWANTLAVQPGKRLLLDWRLGVPEGSTVEFVITTAPNGAQVVVRHDVEGPEFDEMWRLVLVERFAAAAASSLSNF